MGGKIEGNEEWIDTLYGNHLIVQMNEELKMSYCHNILWAHLYNLMLRKSSSLHIVFVCLENKLEAGGGMLACYPGYNYTTTFGIALHQRIFSANRTIHLNSDGTEKFCLRLKDLLK